MLHPKRERSHFFRVCNTFFCFPPVFFCCLLRPHHRLIKILKKWRKYRQKLSISYSLLVVFSRSFWSVLVFLWWSLFWKRDFFLPCPFPTKSCIFFLVSVQSVFHFCFLLCCWCFSLSRSLNSSLCEFVWIDSPRSYFPTRNTWILFSIFLCVFVSIYFICNAQ